MIVTPYKKYFPILIQILMSVSAAALIGFNVYLFKMKLSYSIYIATLFGVFGYYLIDSRPSKNPEDKINKPERWELFKTVEKPLIIIGSAFIFCSIILLINETQSLIPIIFLSFLALMSAFYASFVFNFARRIPYLKTFWVAITWSTAAVLIPMLFGIKLETVAVLPIIVFLFNFTWTFIDTLLLDWKDRHGDSVYGIKTLPQKFSRNGFYFLLLILCSFQIILALIFWHLNFLEVETFRAIISISLVQNLSFFVAMICEKQASFYFQLIVMSWRLAMLIFLAKLP